MRTSAPKIPSIQIPTRRSLKVHKIPLAAAAPPLSLLAPSLRFGPKRSGTLANAEFTNSLLPVTAPSVKYLTRQRRRFRHSQIFQY